MLYFRRLWLSLLGIILVAVLVAEFLLKPLSVLLTFVFNKLSSLSNFNLSFLLSWSGTSSSLAKKIVLFSTSLLVILTIVLVIWFVINLLTKQLMRDFYSIKLANYLQRSQTDSMQMVKSEQDKANYWIKRLRIIEWRQHLYVLVPCGANAAVQSVIKERCDRYCVEWLSSTIKNSHWITKISVHNTILFNWLIIKTK